MSFKYFEDRSILDREAQKRRDLGSIDNKYYRLFKKEKKLVRRSKQNF